MKPDGDNAFVLGAVGVGGVVAIGAGVPEGDWALLELLIWQTNAPAAVAAALGAAGLAIVAVVGEGRRVRWLTSEHRQAARERRAAFRAFSPRTRWRLLAPPLTAFSLVAAPHSVLWLLGATRFRWPDWLGTEVPVEPWVSTLVEALGGPLGNGFTLIAPVLSWGAVVAFAWGLVRHRWEERILHPPVELGRSLLPDPGRYQHDGATWRPTPVFLLGARESGASRDFEPRCELPSWVLHQGKPTFGGLMVFGQKGSGKTSLLKRIINDALGFRPQDAAYKPALMALDPKGDLSGFILEQATFVGREQDVVRLAVGGPTRWNPFGHLTPSTPARQIRQAGYFLACAMPGTGGDNAYWEDNAKNLLSYAMQLLAYAGQTVSFETLTHFVIRLKSGQLEDGQAEEEMSFREQLYADAQANLHGLDPDGSHGLMTELQSVRDYFEEEFVSLAAKPRSIVVNTATNFLRKFEGSAYRRTFGGRVGEPDQFRGFEEMVDEGKIFVLDIRAVEDGQISAALCCLAKLFCQAAILTRDRRDPQMRRVVVNVLDEYQQYVTLGAPGDQDDPKYLETSRSFRAVDVAATQQLTSIKAAVGGRADACQRVIGSFNSLVLFRHNDAELTRHASSLVGQRHQIERSSSVSEGGQDAERQRFTRGHTADKQSVNRSVTERSVPKPLLTDEVFASLQTFEAIAILNGPEGRRPLRFFSKPDWVPTRTPQALVVEHLDA